MASSGASPAWERWVPRAALALVLLRGLLALCLGDVFFYGDELEKGAAGKALLDGMAESVGRHRLAYHYYEGGGLVVSHLDALAFRLVGQNLLALKLVAIGFDLAVLLAGAALMRRAFGARAAAVFALLFVLSPESVQKNSMLALGIHWQALPFLLLTLDRAGRIALEGDTSRSNWVVAGFAGGFGTYFNWGVAPAVAYAALALLVLRRRAFASKGAALGVGAFALGLAPLLWMVSRVGNAVLDIHGTNLLGESSGPPLADVLGAFFDSVYGGRTTFELVFVVLVPLLPLLGLAALVLKLGDLRTGDAPEPATPRRWALYLAGYLALFFALYLKSDFTIGHVAHYFQFHRLSQAWILALLLAAGGLSALLGGGAAARFAGGALIALAVFGGARGTLAVIERGSTVDFAANLEVLTNTKGYRYDEYIPKIWDHLEGDPAARVRALRGFDEVDLELLDYTLAVHLFSAGAQSLAEVRALLPSFGLEQRSLVALGGAWRSRHGGELPERRAAVLASEDAVGVEELVEESFGRFGEGFVVTGERPRRELATGLAHGFDQAFFRGLGYRLFSVRGDRELVGYWRQTLPPCFINHDRAYDFIGRADPSVAQALLEGFRTAVAEHSLR